MKHKTSAASAKTAAHPRYVVCAENLGYEAALEKRKIYRALADEEAAKHRQIRVIDESGEDYLFPARMFVAIDLSQHVEKALALAV
jgi:hypothetical protein